VPSEGSEQRRRSRWEQRTRPAGQRTACRPGGQWNEWNCAPDAGDRGPGRPDAPSLAVSLGTNMLGQGTSNPPEPLAYRVAAAVTKKDDAAPATYSGPDSAADAGVALHPARLCATQVARSLMPAPAGNANSIPRRACKGGAQPWTP